MKGIYKYCIDVDDVILEKCPITIPLSARLTHYGMLRFYTVTTKKSSEV